MGRRRNDKDSSMVTKLREPAGRDSDISDLESLAMSSVTGDPDWTDDDDGVDTGLTINNFCEQIEQAHDKRNATRLKASNNILYLLKKNCDSETAEKWKSSICDIVEKNLKRSVEEALCSCTIVSLLSLQLGVEIEEELQGALAALRALCIDESANEALRAACTYALGFCVFFSCEQLSVRIDTLQTLRSIWTQMRPSNVQPSLFSAALFSWVLLLERCDAGMISQNISEVQPKLCQFFEASSVDVRISAGEALAVLFEVAIENIDEDFRFTNHEHLRTILGDLAIDSAKYRAKRDKKMQKFSFRQINDAIFYDSQPHTQVRFNKRETLDVNGCHAKLLYDTLCQLLKGDINLHLSRNEVLREFFDLGPIVDTSDIVPKSKEEKMERKNLLDASTKARNIHRAKQRDKKAF